MCIRDRRGATRSRSGGTRYGRRRAVDALMTGLSDEQVPQLCGGVEWAGGTGQQDRRQHIRHDVCSCPSTARAHRSAVADIESALRMGSTISSGCADAKAAPLPSARTGLLAGAVSYTHLRAHETVLDL